MTSLTLAAVVMTLSGVPRPSQIRWCLLPVFRRSTGDGPVSGPPFFRTDVGAVHARAGPVEFAGRVEFGEQGAVQLLEDTGLLPATQASPAGLSGAEPQLRGQELSGYVVVEHVQDALQTQPVRYRLRARRLLRPWRQQRLDQRPQLVVHDPRPSTHTLANGRIVTSVTPDQDASPRSCHELIGAGDSKRRRLLRDGVRHVWYRPWRFGDKALEDGARRPAIPSRKPQPRPCVRELPRLPGCRRRQRRSRTTVAMRRRRLRARRDRPGVGSGWRIVRH